MYIELPDKRYYNIGEVAKAFGVNTSLIRFWEKEFNVLKPKKNGKSDSWTFFSLIDGLKSCQGFSKFIWYSA